MEKKVASCFLVIVMVGSLAASASPGPWHPGAQETGVWSS